MAFRSSLQRELDRFYKQLFSNDFNIREITKGALTQSRAKLNPWAFQRLNEVAVEGFYNEASYYTWHEFRTLAVDGTRLMLPNHPTVVEEFGTHQFGPNADAPRSMALGSMLYDVINHLTIDAQIAPYSSSERDLLMDHMPKVKKGDLLLLDRGYPCFWLLYLLKAKGIEFCVRLKDSWWLQVRQFMDAPEKETVVKFKLPKKDRGKLAEYPEMQNSVISCRLIKVPLEDGKIEVLCTSLLNTQQYKYEEFESLYHYRWNEEEAYKLLKARVELEAFSGKTARAVKQDFFAKVFLLTMCAAFAHPIEEKVREEFKADKERKYAQKINKTNAIATLMDFAIPIFLKNKARNALEAFDEIVYKTREIIRPNRSEPRPKKPRKQYHMNYKRI
jgi:hypothetical protein